MKLLGLILGFVLLSSVITPYAFADRFDEWLEIHKKQEEKKAIEYQKSILHFDYAKIQNKDPGFKTGIPAKEPPKKHVVTEKRIVFKIIKQT